MSTNSTPGVAPGQYLDIPAPACSRGRLLWQTTYGGPGIDLGFDAVEAADGSIYVAGELSPDGSPGLAPLGETDLLLLKIR